MQVSISNGSPISWAVKPEDFSYRQQDGAVWQASPALSVVYTLLAKGGRHDVIKLVTTYERGVYGNEHMQTTNGYESRRQSALAEGMSARLKAGAAASALALPNIIFLATTLLTPRGYTNLPRHPLNLHDARSFTR